MSGVFKSIGKIFKKVIKVVKKIALPALAIAAIVITGGAALGLIPMIGGVAITGVGSLATALTGSAALGTILGSAATGAVIGAGTAALTGGNIIKGATTGFIGGAVTGGISGALGGFAGKATTIAADGTVTGAANGVQNAAQAGIDAANTASQVGGVVAPSAAASAATEVGAARIAGLGTGLDSALAANAARVSGAVGNTAVEVGSRGIMGFLNKNPTVFGEVLKGIGSALMGDPEAEYLEKRDKRRRKSYDIDYDPGRNIPDDSGLQSANERYGGAVYGNGSYEYDPQTGRIRPKEAVGGGG